jgi:hypothetical protein
MQTSSEAIPELLVYRRSQERHVSKISPPFKMNSCVSYCIYHIDRQYYKHCENKLIKIEIFATFCALIEVRVRFTLTWSAFVIGIFYRYFVDSFSQHSVLKHSQSMFLL